MRIRKRPVPFPQSFLSPLPISDPHFSRSPVVQLQLNTNPLSNLPQDDHTPTFFDPPSFDQPNHQPIGGGRNRHVCSDGTGAQGEAKDFPKDESGGGGGGGESSNDSRWGSFLGAETETMVHQLSNSSHQVGRWCEGDKAFPLKKRRGNFERSKEETTVAKDKKMKTKMNKKCLQRNGDQEEEEDMVTKEGIDAGNTSSGKRRVRGSVLMEGSQCSRVNGRGWRCCQQTLVGYSLCEHHLGKGRLRSMTSVRSRTMGSATASNKAISSQPLPSTSLPSEDKEQKHLFPGNKLGGEGEEEEDDKKKPSMVSKKKKKLGIVKARSIRCLLGQANNAIAVAENNK